MKPKVSVFMLTYNQKEFISQAIEGVLMQETNFPVELVIGEDFSTDGTREICLEYYNKYPDKIKLQLNNANIGLGNNYVRTLSACTGKYVAICDGDDYWTDPLKLQKQVNYLENNPDYDIAFTNNKNILPSGKISIRDPEIIPEISDFSDLVAGNYIASVTVMFRNKQLPNGLKCLIKELPFGDWPTYLWVIRGGGQIKFLDDVTAVYRKDFGTSKFLRRNRSKMGEIKLSIYEKLKLELNEHEDVIGENIKLTKRGLMASYFKDGQYLDFSYLWLKLSYSDNFFLIQRIILKLAYNKVIGKK